MKTKLKALPIAVCLLVLVSTFSFAPAEAATEKVRKGDFEWNVSVSGFPPIDYDGDSPYELYGAEVYDFPPSGEIVLKGWYSWTLSEADTPQGNKIHLNHQIKFDVIYDLTGEVIGKGSITSSYTELVNGDEYYIKFEEHMVVKGNGVTVDGVCWDKNGVEYRLKIAYMVSNGEVKIQKEVEFISVFP